MKDISTDLYTMNYLTELILKWGRDKGLHDSDLRPQFIKLTEELGELAAGIARNSDEQILDAVGDFLVVLINFGACFAEHQYPDSEEDRLRVKQYFLTMCLNQAWKEIKDRQGHTKDGVFVKEEE